MKKTKINKDDYRKNPHWKSIVCEGSKTFKTFDPISNIENSSIHYEASQKEINEAVCLASDALKNSDYFWREKSSFFTCHADEILALDDELIQTYCSETGLPEGRAKGERGRTVFNSVLLQIWLQKVLG